MMNSMKTVVAFGTFDIIHPGHLYYLEYALGLGDRLIAVITPDAVALRSKGAKPLFTERERMRIISSLRCVDRVVLGDSDGSWRNVMRCSPDSVCFGYDQKAAIRAFREHVSKVSAMPVAVHMAPAFRPQRYHSAHLKLLV